jgi:hypothetical protein
MASVNTENKQEPKLGDIPALLDRLMAKHRHIDEYSIEDLRVMYMAQWKLTEWYEWHLDESMGETKAAWQAFNQLNESFSRVAALVPLKRQRGRPRKAPARGKFTSGGLLGSFWATPDAQTKKTQSRVLMKNDPELEAIHEILARDRAKAKALGRTYHERTALINAAKKAGAPEFKAVILASAVAKQIAVWRRANGKLVRPKTNREI